MGALEGVEWELTTFVSGDGSCNFSEYVVSMMGRGGEGSDNEGE